MSKTKKENFCRKDLMKTFKKTIVIIIIIWSIVPFISLPFDLMMGHQLEFLNYLGLLYWALVVLVGVWYLRNTKEKK